VHPWKAGERTVGSTDETDPPDACAATKAAEEDKEGGDDDDKDATRLDGVATTRRPRRTWWAE
jgi:hypothetical protein